jgi:hypothetical protein
MKNSIDAELLIVRNARDNDMSAVQAIYRHYVLHSVATFEEVPPTAEEMLLRRASVLANGLPYLVAEIEGRVVGYCYATTHRARIATRSKIRFTWQRAWAEWVSGRRCFKRSLRAVKTDLGGRWWQWSATAPMRHRSACIAALALRPWATCSRSVSNMADGSIPF